MNNFITPTGLSVMEKRAFRDTIKHLHFMGLQMVRDRFDLTSTQMVEYWAIIEGVIAQYQNNEITWQNLLDYASEVQNPYKWINTVPKNQRVIILGYKNIKGTPEKIKQIIDASILLYYCSGIISLIKLEIKQEEIAKYGKYLADFIDSYAKGYLTDELVNEMLVEECGLDLIKGTDVEDIIKKLIKKEKAKQRKK